MTTRARLLAAPVALLVLAALGACGSSNPTTNTTSTTAASPAGPTITLKNIQFHPADLHISRGATVTWKWEDADIATQHNVTSTGGRAFKGSPTQMTGTYSVKFTTAGTYDFECTIHPASMQGHITVN
jgi:plastocyanin